MPKMTIAWLLIYFGSWIASFVNPIYGVLGYMFEYYLRPSLHWWGRPLPDLRWNLAVALVAILAYFLRRNVLPELPSMRNPALKWIVGLAVLMLVITPFAADVELSLAKANQFHKMVVFYLLVAAVVRSRWAFDAVAAMHMAGAAWWGYEQWLDPRREASRLAHVGSADTLGDNLAAAHLLTVIPFIFVYLFTAEDKRLRALALVAAPFVMNLFILCNSRGGTVGLVVGVLAALLLTRRGQRLRLMAAVPVVIAGFLALADPEFLQRQQTTMQYRDEGTAIERIESWRGGIAMLKAYPFGVGGEGFELLYADYAPEVAERHSGARRAPHNTYVLVATEWGVLGLGMYLGLIGSTFLMLWKVRRRSTPADGFFYRAFALQVGLIATLTASTFSDRLYGESFYWMCALAVALYRMQHATVAEPAAQVQEQAATPPAAPLRWRAQHA